MRSALTSRVRHRRIRRSACRQRQRSTATAIGSCSTSRPRPRTADRAASARDVSSTRRGPGERGHPTTTGAGPRGAVELRRLRDELRAAQRAAYGLCARIETSNRSSAQPTRSCNRSTRNIVRPPEELETSKEELQSINEELQTVNSELKLKLDTISRAHSDLQNLMAPRISARCSSIPELRIQRFAVRSPSCSMSRALRSRPPADRLHAQAEVRRS